jgi:hypothetical protein
MACNEREIHKILLFFLDLMYFQEGVAASKPKTSAK